MKKQTLFPLLILLFLALGTTVVIFFGRGYRFDFLSGKPGISGTGLLVATSNPNGASVFVDNHLTTATDNTINLPAGEYTIRITKEGYFPWEKRLKVQNEVVSKADALLIPIAPKLESITARGVTNPKIDPSLTKIAYTVASDSARKNGIYILDMSSRPLLTLQSSSFQITDDTVDLFSQAIVSWSPDGQELLATISASPTVSSTYLLKANEFNASPQDVTATLASVGSTWEKEKIEKRRAQLENLKPALKEVITNSFDIIAWSPDDTKILYTATNSATFPLIINPRLIGANSTEEERSVKTGAIYIYDIKEDKNFKIVDSIIQKHPVIQKPLGLATDLLTPQTEVPQKQFEPPLTWFPDSKHLLYVHDNRIEIVEYDGLNATTIYAGPFVDNYVYTWPNGSKIVILTNLNNFQISPNLYTISLK